MILNVVDHLPTASHYREAVAMDEELAELTEHLEVPTRQRPVLPVSEMTYEVQLLTQVIVMLRNIYQQRERKRVKFPPLPAPKTARQIVADRRRQENRDLLMTRVTEAQARWAELNPTDSTSDQT